jgi:serine/threonine protein kinase
MSEYFGKRYGPYVILEQLGQGGMARVFNALDSRTHQNVAIKIILPGKHTSRAFLDQFEKEAKSVAGLTHSNIVKVLDYGIQDEQPYLVMEYVPGGSLKDAMKHKVPWQTAAAFLAPIARALEYVHQQQIVHRDVKPSNILLQDDCRPMLADFGIVKVLESKDEKMEEAIGVGVGTPEYMPPEQAMGKDVDFRVDIYSLGLVYYEMITGKKPFIADSPIALAIRHVTDKLPLPTKIDKTIPKFVEHVILRAVQKNPEDRFTSMAHFAEALELIAQGEGASAGRITRITRQQKRKRKFPVPILLASIFLFFLLLGISFATFNYMMGNKMSNGQPVVPIPSQVSSKGPGATPGALPAKPTSTSGPTASPQDTVSPTSGKDTVFELSLIETPLPQNIPAQFAEIARWGIGRINTARWSPDGSTLALGTTSGIFLYNASTKELQRFINTGFNVTRLSFRPSGDELVAGSTTGLVRSWNPQSGQVLQSYTYRVPKAFSSSGIVSVTAITYSPDGEKLAVGYDNGSVNYFERNQGNPVWEFVNPPTIADMVISADGRFIFISNTTSEIKIWDQSNENQAPESLPNPAAVERLKLSNDGQWLLAGGAGQAIYLWDPNTREVIGSFAGLGSTPTDFDFSSDGKYVAIGLKTGNIKVFETPQSADVSGNQVIHSSFTAYQGPVSYLAFSPREHVIAAGNGLESLQVLDAGTGAQIHEFKNDISRVNKLYFSSNGAWLATAHDGGVIRVWDVQQAKEVYSFQGYLPIRGDPFSPDNRLLVIVQASGKNKSDVLKVFDLEKGGFVASLSDYERKAFVQFSEDAKLLVMGDPYFAKVWDAATWQEVNINRNAIEECGRYLTPQGNLVTVISNAGVLFTYTEMIESLCATNPQGAILKYFFTGDNKLLFVLPDCTIWKGFSTSRDLRILKPAAACPVSDEIFLAGDAVNGWYAYTAGTALNITNMSSNTGTKIEEQDDYKYQVALLPGKKLMAFGSQYGSIHMWSMP